MIEELLQKIGLSEKMAKVYGTVLEFGPQTAQQIAQKVGFPRPTVYVQIVALTNKGLMSKVEKGAKTYFIAESPENLERHIEEKLTKFKLVSRELRKNLPRLNLMLETTDERPKIRFFEGREGIMTLVKDFKASKFNSAEEFVSLDKAYETMPPSENDFRNRLVKKFKKTPMRIIYTSKHGPILKNKEGSEERRFIPLEKFPYSGAVTIYGNKIALISQDKHLVGIIIENREIANTLRVLFNFAWESIAPREK